MLTTVPLPPKAELYTQSKSLFFGGSIYTISSFLKVVAGFEPMTLDTNSRESKTILQYHCPRQYFVSDGLQPSSFNLGLVESQSLIYFCWMGRLSPGNGIGCSSQDASSINHVCNKTNQFKTFFGGWPQRYYTNVGLS